MITEKRLLKWREEAKNMRHKTEYLSDYRKRMLIYSLARRILLLTYELLKLEWEKQAEGFIKIGASANPFNRYSRRRDQYKYGFTNMKLLLQVRVDDCFQYEAALHHKYTEYRIGNSDWFNFKIRPMGGSDE
jgi:hypothetical protein